MSILVARTRRLDLAEDALGEAFARASARWPAHGVPDNPAAWLHTTASRLIVDGLRAEAMRGRKAPLLAVDSAWTPGSIHAATDELGDDRLVLILLCCHPALHPDARSPLALRLVVGTSTAEIARLFLVGQATMAARLTRAKKKIVAAGIPLARPIDDELQRRLDDVCRTIYLAFTAGYTPGRGDDLLRIDLAGDAVELASVLHQLVPGSTQVQALRSLLLLQHARRDSRLAAGQLVTLPDQDRSRWHRDEIETAARLLGGLAPSSGYAEELRLQGLIALEHATAPTAPSTDWPKIAQLYRDLEQLTGSAVVRLNRAVAVAEAGDIPLGLSLLEDLDGLLPGNHRLHAVRASLAERLPDPTMARAEYRLAIETCDNEIELRHLEQRADALGQTP